MPTGEDTGDLERYLWLEEEEDSDEHVVKQMEDLKKKHRDKKAVREGHTQPRNTPEDHPQYRKPPAKGTLAHAGTAMQATADAAAIMLAAYRFPFGIDVGGTKQVTAFGRTSRGLPESRTDDCRRSRWAAAPSSR